MNLLENMLDTLTDLKENHHVLAVKTEFEDEGTNFKEACLLKEIAAKANLDLTIKIGGCGALNDIYEAKNMNVHAIVAPMIESPYALKKFMQTVKTAYYDEEIKKPELFINIETITGYKNLNQILSIPEVKYLTGVVVGRLDMAKSIGLTCKDINCEEIFEIVNDLAVKTKNIGKKLFIGGGISKHSFEFFNRLPGNILNGFETRKIIFDADYTLKNQDTEGILKAIEFEIMWLKNKQVIWGNFHDKDIRRFQILEKRSEELIAKIQNGLCNLR